MAFFPPSWVIETDEPEHLSRPATPQRRLETRERINPLLRRGSLSCVLGFEHSQRCHEHCDHDDIYPHELLHPREKGHPILFDDDDVYATLPVPPKSHPLASYTTTADANVAPPSAAPRNSTSTAVAGTRQRHPRDRYPSQFPTSWLLNVTTPSRSATPSIAGRHRGLFPPAAPSPQISFASIPTTESSFSFPPTPDPVLASQPILAKGGDLPIRTLNILQGPDNPGAGEQDEGHENMPRTTLAALADLKERTSVQNRATDMVGVWVESQSLNHEAESVASSIQAVTSNTARMPGATPGAAGNADSRLCGLAFAGDADTAMDDDSDESDDSGLGDAPHVAHDTGDEYSVYSDMSD